MEILITECILSLKPTSKKIFVIVKNFFGINSVESIIVMIVSIDGWWVVSGGFHPKL